MRPAVRSVIAVVAVAAAGCGEKPPTAHIVPLAQVPGPVLATAREKLPNVKFDLAWRTPDGNYEVRGTEPSGKTRDICTTPKGEVVEID